MNNFCLGKLSTVYKNQELPQIFVRAAQIFEVPAKWSRKSYVLHTVTGNPLKNAGPRQRRLS
jgi:hypothetical protein